MFFTTRNNLVKKGIPTVCLTKINWDDYSYSTSFDAVLYHDGKVIELGEVKVMTTQLDDESTLDNRKENTSTKLPETFEKLGEDFYSLGQHLDYYRGLSELGKELGDKVLHGLRDTAVYYPPEEGVKEHKAFWDSLLRGSEAKKCLKEGRDYYFGCTKYSKIEFTYKGSVFDKSDSSVHFVFDMFSELPSTINVLIGRNGSGKTRLLNRLSYDIVENNDDSVFIPERPPISRVVAISYSAFDDFNIPEKERDYKYIGIRKRDEKNGDFVIKSSRDHWKDVSDALWEIEDVELLEEVERFIETSLSEHIEDAKDLKKLKASFESMSSGQKISLSIICQLSAFLEDDSLVLFDEPENHLHPGLLWSLMVSFDRVLKKKKSFSIVATHSPVILQQIPSDYINVVHRSGAVISAENLDNESFGENLQVIMEKSFGFVEPEHDYKQIIKSLIKDKGYGKDQIEGLFSKSLGLQARAFLSTATKKERND